MIQLRLFDCDSMATINRMSNNRLRVGCKTYTISGILANHRVISNKIPWSIQSSKQRRFNVLINIFFPITRPLLSNCMDVVWQNSALHNIQASFKRRNIHHINVCLMEIDLFLFTMTIWKFQLQNNVRTLKPSPQKYLLIFACRGPL